MPASSPGTWRVRAKLSDVERFRTIECMSASGQGRRKHRSRVCQLSVSALASQGVRRGLEAPRCHHRNELSNHASAAIIQRSRGPLVRRSARSNFSGLSSTMGRNENPSFAACSLRCRSSLPAARLGRASHGVTVRGQRRRGLAKVMLANADLPPSPAGRMGGRTEASE